MLTFSERGVNLFLYALLGIGFPVYVIFSKLGLPLTGADDANIVFVYAKNWVHGHGIVYNAGGEHVEGFTSFLYFLICSVFFLFTDQPEVALLSYNLVIAGLSVGLMLFAVRQMANKIALPTTHLHMLYWLYLAWLLLNPLYYSWTMIALMDAGTYTFLLIAAYACLIHRIGTSSDNHTEQKILYFLIAALVLCRPEGMVWGLVCVLAAGFIDYQEDAHILSTIKKSMRPMLAYVVTLVALTAFRLAYFGYALPNTYYAKVSSSFTSTLTDGYQYFLKFMTLYGVVALLPTLFLLFWVLYVSFFKQKKAAHYEIAIITLLFVMAGLLLPIVEGGDHFNGVRFYQACYPFLVLPCFLFLLIFYDKTSWPGFFASGLLLILLMAKFSHATWDNFIYSNQPVGIVKRPDMRVAMEFYIANNSRENARLLNQIFAPELPVIGYGSAGGITYAYNGTVYDMMGLNNTLLAHADTIKEGPKGHQSFNKSVFYQLAPDLLMPTAITGFDMNSLLHAHQYYTNPTGWDNLIFKNIFNDAEFKREYQLALIQNLHEPRYSCYAYVKQTYLEKLSQQENFRIKRFSV